MIRLAGAAVPPPRHPAGHARRLVLAIQPTACRSAASPTARRTPSPSAARDARTRQCAAALGKRRSRDGGRIVARLGVCASADRGETRWSSVTATATTRLAAAFPPRRPPPERAPALQPHTRFVANSAAMCSITTTGGKPFGSVSRIAPAPRRPSMRPGRASAAGADRDSRERRWTRQGREGRAVERLLHPASRASTLAAVDSPVAVQYRRVTASSPRGSISPRRQRKVVRHARRHQQDRARARAMIRFVASTPSITGITRSISTTSGRSSPAQAHRLGAVLASQAML